MDSSPGGLVMPHLLNWVSLHFPACEEQARYVSSGCTVGYRNGGRGVWGDVWNLLKLWNFQHWKVHGAYFCKPDTFFNSFELCGGRIEPLNWPERAPFQNLHHNYFSCCQICICPFSCTVGLSVAWHEMGSVKFNVYSCVTCKYTNTTTQIQIHNIHPHHHFGFHRFPSDSNCLFRECEILSLSSLLQVSSAWRQ